MDGDLTYPELFREALMVAQRMGTWVLYDIQDEENIDYVIGYFRGRISDFVRRRIRTTSERDREHYKERIGHWKRAIILAQRMGQSQHQALASRIIADMGRDREYRKVPFVAVVEVTPGRSRTRGKLRERARKRPGKPRAVPLQAVDFRACDQCMGEGFFRKTGGQR